MNNDELLEQSVTDLRKILSNPAELRAYAERLTSPVEIDLKLFATKEYPTQNFYVSPYGSTHTTSEGLKAAEAEWKRNNLRFHVNDALTGRKEVAPGSGPIDVCIGFEFNTDEFGHTTETPIYRRETY